MDDKSRGYIYIYIYIYVFWRAREGETRLAAIKFPVSGGDGTGWYGYERSVRRRRADRFQLPKRVVSSRFNKK